MESGLKPAALTTWDKTFSFVSHNTFNALPAEAGTPYSRGFALNSKGVPCRGTISIFVLCCFPRLLRPLPWGEGDLFPLSGKPQPFDLRTRWLRSSLSPRERAGVGEGATNMTCCSKHTPPVLRSISAFSARAFRYNQRDVS